MILEDALKEITEKTEVHAGASIAPAKSKSIHRLNSIRVPVQRKLVKDGYAFLTDSRDENLRAWDYIWRHSGYMEVMNQALYFYQHKPLNKKEFTKIRGWAERCESWEHSDDLSKIYADVVESHPDWILPTLRRWNRSSSFWKRRKSMTSLIEYATKRSRFQPYEELISFVEPLLDDEAYYVQKGLGWTVREIGNAYPVETWQFLTRNAARLAPQAWSGATKNMSRLEKAELKVLRQVASG